MKKNFKKILLRLSAAAAVTLLVQGCSKENAVHPKGKPAGDYSYDPSSISSILNAVDRKNGTNYSAAIGNASAKENPPDYIRGIVDPYFPSRCFQPFNWFCEIIIYGKSTGKEKEGFIGKQVDLISCTPVEPTLYKDVTILDYIETSNGSEIIFE